MRITRPSWPGGADWSNSRISSSKAPSSPADCSSEGREKSLASSTISAEGRCESCNSSIRDVTADSGPIRG